METIENIKKVSLVFFLITGLLHLSSIIFIANNLFLKYTGLINRVMDIPFIITGLIYGFASLRLGLTDPAKEHRTLDITLLSIVILILLGLIFINLFLPDKIQ